jgi:hypothetical protein
MGWTHYIAQIIQQGRTKESLLLTTNQVHGVVFSEIIQGRGHIANPLDLSFMREAKPYSRTDVLHLHDPDRQIFGQQCEPHQ